MYLTEESLVYKTKYHPSYVKLIICLISNSIPFKSELMIYIVSYLFFNQTSPLLLPFKHEKLERKFPIYIFLNYNF